MVKRITYSKRNKARDVDQTSVLNDDDASRKRRRTDSPSDSSSYLSLLTPSPGSSIRQKSSSFIKKASQAFSGPISVPADEADAASSPKTTKSSRSLSGLFDKALHGRLNPQKSRQPTIHGSPEEFAKAIRDRQNPITDKQPRGLYLPTPPSEAHRSSSNDAGSVSSSTQGRTIKSDLESLSLHDSVSVTSKPPGKDLQSPRVRQPYVPRNYLERKTTAPRANLYGDRLSKRSQQAQLWSTNQTDSPLLRLPGEVRNRIYEYTLGGNTILIGYKTYSSTENDHMVPTFRYWCTILNHRTDPFVANPPPYVKVTHKFTPLNNVCRQLYYETAVLPYKLNDLAFESHNIMFNFLFLEQRLSREQCDAITTFALPDALPHANLVVFMRNLQKVELAFSRGGREKGTYRVFRRDGKAPELKNTKHIWEGVRSYR